MADAPIDPREIVQGLAKFNPVTAIPGMIQQGQQAIDPAMQQIMMLYQKLFGAPGMPQSPAQPQAPASGLKQKITGSY